MAEDEDNRLLWQIGLPNADELTPLTLQLVPSELASAFKISPESSKTVNDVNRASENTLSSLRRWHSLDMNYKQFNNEETVTEKDETDEGSDPRKIRRVGSSGSGGVEDADSGNFAAAAAAVEVSEPRKFDRVGLGGVEDADSGNCAAAETMAVEEAEEDTKMLKRARLVWTPQLHKRFIEVVAHLGIKNAVPKTIMQLMNVEGLTRENVASHLQKYRLYLKRQLNDHHHQQGNSNSSEQSRGNNTNGHVAMAMNPMAYPPQQMMGYGGGGQQMGFQHHHHQYQYGNMVQQQQQREWSGNNFGYYHPVASNDK